MCNKRVEDKSEKRGREISKEENGRERRREERGRRGGGGGGWEREEQAVMCVLISNVYNDHRS